METTSLPQTRKPMPWYYGLIPPGWCAIQMIIMFANIDTIFRSTAWKWFFGIEALITFAAMYWWLNKLTGKKSPRQIKFGIVWTAWCLFSYVGWRIVDGMIPRPNYFAIGGTGDEHIRLTMEASTKFANTSLLFSVGYAIVLFSGITVLLWLYHRKNLFATS